MYRYILSIIVAIAINAIEAQASTQIVMDEIHAEGTPDRLAEFGIKIAPLLARLHTVEKKEGFKLIPGLMDEYMSEQGRLNNECIGALRSMKIIPVKERKEAQKLYYYLEPRRTKGEQFYADTLKKMFQECETNFIDGKPITPFQLQILIYNLCSKIFSSKLDLARLSIARQLNYKIYEDKATDFSKLNLDELEALFLKTQETIERDNLLRYFEPAFDINKTAFAIFFGQNHGPENSFFLEAIDNSLTKFLKDNDTRRRAFLIAGICFSIKASKIHFTFHQQPNWLETYQNLNKNVSSGLKLIEMKSIQTPIIDGRENVTDITMPAWMAGIFPQLTAIFNVHNLGAKNIAAIMKLLIEASDKEFAPKIENYLNKVQGTSKALHSENLALKNQLSQVTHNYTLLKEEKVPAQAAEIKKQQEQNKSLREELTLKKDAYKVAKKDLEAALAENKKLQISLRKSESAENQSAAQLITSSEKIANVTQTMMTLRQELKEAKKAEKALRVAEAKLTEAAKLSDKNKRVITDLKADNTILEGALRVAEAKIAETTNLSAQHESVIADLKADNIALQASTKSLEEALRVKDNEIAAAFEKGQLSVLKVVGTVK